MISPERVGHVVLKVRDLERTRQFYTEVMGFRITKTYPEAKIIFFGISGRDHHEIAFSEIGKDAQGPRKEDIGLFHVAFRLRDWSHLQAAYNELRARNVPITGTVNHGITRSLYFLDPDGHQLEVYCDNPRWREVIGTNRADKLDIDGEEPEAVPAMHANGAPAAK